MKTTRPRGARLAAPTLPTPVSLLAVAALSSLVMAMAGCGGDDSLTGSGSELQMLVAVTISPDPVVAVPLAEGDSFEWSATYTVTLTESGGVGGTIVGLGVTLSAAADGQPIDTEEDPSSTTAEDTDTRLEALSTKDLALTTHYSVPGDGSEAFIEVLFQIQDDDGFVIQGGKTFPVS